MQLRIFFTFVCLLPWIWGIVGAERTTSSPRTRGSTGKEFEEEALLSAKGIGEGHLYPPPLVSPYGGTIKFLVGIAVPISMTGGRILSFGQNFQFQYAMPQNATFFTNFLDDTESRATAGGSSLLLLRRRRDRSAGPDDARSIFYRSLELAYDRWGGHGRICVLRSICEAAAAPVEGEGLVGELLHLAFTPDYGRPAGLHTPDVEDDDDDDDEDDYLRAARAGRTDDRCSLIYPGCPEGAGLLDRISLLRHFA